MARINFICDDIIPYLFIKSPYSSFYLGFVEKEHNFWIYLQYFSCVSMGKVESFRIYEARKMKSLTVEINSIQWAPAKHQVLIEF